MQERKPALVVHGGAWNIPDAQWEGHLRGVLQGLRAGMKVLEGGGSALEAVLEAVGWMEEDTIFDAGVGSVLNRQGRVQLDAGLMCGETLQVGSVAAMERCRSPIRAAHEVLQDERVVMLVGDGADAFAEEKGLEMVDNEVFVVERERQNFARYKEMDDGQLAVFFAKEGVGDTVGAVALDAQGRIAAGNSTGGTPYKHEGRVGDSPLAGCGYLADNWLGGVCCTGWGEYIVRGSLASRVLGHLRAGLKLQHACQAGVEFMSRRLDGRVGVIALDPRGHLGASYSTGRMAWAGFDSEGNLRGPEELRALAEEGA